MKQLIVAAAQIACQDGQVLANLKHASRFVQQAHEKGAEIVLFHEFMPQGYRLRPEIWDVGEPLNGPTTAWLRRNARQHGMYIGTSFLEARGEHFHNTFALAGPDGRLAGTVCKRNPSIWEAFFFIGLRNPQYIDTEIGRIGVGICFDNHTFEVAEAIRHAGVDLMLMPHCYFTPTRLAKGISQADIDRLNELPVRVARQYNELFGVPVVVANRSGAFDSPAPKTILGQMNGYSFSGRSLILDANGTLKAQMGDEEGLVTATVTLDPACKRQTRPPKYGRYIYPGPVGREIFRLIEAQGYWSYRRSSVRKATVSRCAQKA